MLPDPIVYLVIYTSYIMDKNIHSVVLSDENMKLIAVLKYINSC